MAENIVEVRNAKYRYDSVEAVKGVTFDIREGEIFGLLGRNGAGKSTTISMIAGILPPAEGEIRVAGEDVRHQSLSLKRAVGMTPQELAIYPKLTARENLSFFGELYGLRGIALKTRIEEMLELVSLTSRADDKSDDYSGGMKRRLNLACGLMHSPRLFLLDEPTVGVDVQSRNHIFDGVRSLNERGLSVLYTSHYVAELEKLCHRVGIIHEGLLIACDTVSNLTSSLGGSKLEVSSTEPTDIDGLIRDVGALPGVTSVNRIPSEEDDSPCKIVIVAERPDETLAAVINVMNRHAVVLHSLNTREPSLEDIFLKLTNTTLQD